MVKSRQDMTTGKMLEAARISPRADDRRLFLNKASPQRPGEVAFFSNVQTPTESVEGNEETGKHSPNKGTTPATNLQKLDLKK